MKSHKLTLYYDQDCSLCRRFSLLIDRWDKGNDIRKLPLCTLDASSSLCATRAKEAIGTLDKRGRVRYGFHSLWAIFSALPRGRWLLPFLFLLRISGIGGGLYLLVARNRERLGWPREVSQRQTERHKRNQA